MYVVTMAAAAASAINSAEPRKNLIASGIEKPLRCAISISAIGIPSVGFAELVRVLRDLALRQFQSHVAQRRARVDHGVPRIGSLVPDDEVAFAFRQIG